MHVLLSLTKTAQMPQNQFITANRRLIPHESTHIIVGGERVVGLNTGDHESPAPGPLQNLELTGFHAL